MAAWKTLVFPCLLVSATLIVALPQRGSQVIENAGTSLFEKEINYTLSSYCCRILTTLINKRSTNVNFPSNSFFLNYSKKKNIRSI